MGRVIETDDPGSSEDRNGIVDSRPGRSRGCGLTCHRVEGSALISRDFWRGGVATQAFALVR